MLAHRLKSQISSKGESVKSPSVTERKSQPSGQVSCGQACSLDLIQVLFMATMRRLCPESVKTFLLSLWKTLPAVIWWEKYYESVCRQVCVTLGQLRYVYFLNSRRLDSTSHRPDFLSNSVYLTTVSGRVWGKCGASVCTRTEKKVKVLFSLGCVWGRGEWLSADQKMMNIITATWKT